MNGIKVTALAAALTIVCVGELVAAVPPSGPQIIRIDGSSTVYPITEAVAEEFGRNESKVKVTVGISGTGGGMKKFCSGELDIVDASRPIKSSENEACAKSGVDYVELPVAFDALTVVVNKNNDWARSITVTELKRLWEPAAQGKVTTWKQLRDSWPDRPIRLYGPGVDSGTFDYFTEAIVGKAQSSRGDYTSSEDDNVVVQGIANDPNALGYFGLSYYEQNAGVLRALPVDDEKAENGSGPQDPTLSNVLSGAYQPLARPLFIYVRAESLARPEVVKFVSFYLRESPQLVSEVGYIPLQEKVQAAVVERFERRTAGSIYGTNVRADAGLTELLSATE